MKQIVSISEPALSRWGCSGATARKSPFHFLLKILKNHPLVKEQEAVTGIDHLSITDKKRNVLKMGNDPSTTNQELLQENFRLKQRILELEQLGTSSKQVEEALRERIKELNCLYSIADMIEKTETIGEIFQKAADLIPKSWYYAELACARIIYGDQEFKTENFQESAWKMSADMVVNGELTGVVEVCYLKEMPDICEGPFLKEERDLIDAVAERLGKVAKRKQYEKDLAKLISEMQTAISKIKTLSGLLPICAACKKIRNDAGYWEQIESFIAQHSEAEFSHSICPDCARKLYPELYEGR
jgi:hypothetical protein